MTTQAPTAPEEAVTAHVAAAIGDSPAAAETQAVLAVKWFETVEVEEFGFKAFVRLPNDYQHTDIREKAMAAKARRIRQLKHPDTDANVVLESELDEIAAAGNDAIEAIVTELLGDRFYRDREDAQQDVDEEEEFSNARQDMERYRELDNTEADKRSADEWKELTEHLAKRAAAIASRVEAIQKPHRDALRAMPVNDLIDKLREKRINMDAMRVFRDTFEFWQMYVCTLKVPDGFDAESITPATMPKARYFATDQELRDFDSTVITRLSEAFFRLETGMASLTSGNS